ncbi:hypothetical protein C8A03DRAFT_35726 [Achaetomium macrosporum]|uniref:Uncharacterized protein n=1 Tax=Achaetomium macrosporum TaxID=79813 RepID=A0AAN7H5U5_9PEZI|nr:hypothetical protein C8A03DRAFT_35726 [Achaetomium macrosporum]
MKISLLTLATASLASVSQGYRLSFYLVANCRNALLETQFPVVGPPNFVCRGIPSTPNPWSSGRRISRMNKASWSSGSLRHVAAA